MTLDEINSIAKQLEGEVQMYDALTREHLSGNKEAVELDEVREWAMHGLEAIQKALFSINKCKKMRTWAEMGDKQYRDDSINSLFYLKDRITSIEQSCMTASPFRSLSPKSNDAGKEAETTAPSASTRPEGRNNPFNQVVGTAEIS